MADKLIKKENTQDSQQTGNSDYSIDNGTLFYNMIYDSNGEPVRGENPDGSWIMRIRNADGTTDWVNDKGQTLTPSNVLEEVSVTPNNGKIDDEGNEYDKEGNLTKRASTISPDNRNWAEKNIVSPVQNYFSELNHTLNTGGVPGGKYTMPAIGLASLAGSDAVLGAVDYAAAPIAKWLAANPITTKVIGAGIESPFIADVINRRVVNGQNPTYGQGDNILSSYVLPAAEDLMDASVLVSGASKVPTAVTNAWNAGKSYLQTSPTLNKIMADYNVGKLKYSSLDTFKKVNEIVKNSENPVEAAKAIYETFQAAKKGSGPAYNIGKFVGFEKQRWTPNSLIERAKQVTSEYINKHVSVPLDSYAADLQHQQSNLQSGAPIRQYQGLFPEKTLYDYNTNNEVPRISKIDWEKIPYKEIANLPDNALGSMPRSLIIEREGKPVVETVQGYTPTFTNGDYNLVLFSDNPEVRTLQGSLSSSKANTTALMTPNGKMVQTPQKYIVAERQVPQEYIDGQLSNSNYIVQRYGGADNVVSYGSSKLITDQGAPHVSGDQDFYITREALEKYVKPEVASGKSIHVSSDGPAGRESRYTIVMDGNKYGSDVGDHNHPARIDFNIIDRDVLNAANGSKESRAVQIFRQLFPKEYKEEVLRIKGNPTAVMQIPFTNEELFAKARENQDILSILDSFEASGLNAMESGNKHIGRWPELILGNNPDAMDKAIRQYAKMQYGPDAQLPTFGLEAFQDEAANLELLKKINFPGNIELIAKSPEATRNAFNLMYVQESGFTRNFNYNPSLGAFAGTHRNSIYNGLTQFSNVTDKGGTAGGKGLDVVSGGISRPATYIGNVQKRTAVDGTGKALENGGFQPLRDMSQYKTPTELWEVLDRELGGNIPITINQIEELNKLGYHIPTDGSVNTLREALLLKYEGSHMFEPEVQKYINTTWPDLMSRDVYDWTPDSGWSQGSYGSGKYREVLGQPTEDKVAWTYGNNAMMSTEGTRNAVFPPPSKSWAPDEYQTRTYDDSRSIYAPSLDFLQNNSNLIQNLALRKSREINPLLKDANNAYHNIAFRSSLTQPKFPMTNTSLILNPYDFWATMRKDAQNEGVAVLTKPKDNPIALSIALGQPIVYGGMGFGTYALTKWWEEHQKAQAVDDQNLANLVQNYNTLEKQLQTRQITSEQFNQQVQQLIQTYLIGTYKDKDFSITEYESDLKKLLNGLKNYEYDDYLKEKGLFINKNAKGGVINTPKKYLIYFKNG